MTDLKKLADEYADALWQSRGQEKSANRAAYMAGARAAVAQMVLFSQGKFDSCRVDQKNTPLNRVHYAQAYSTMLEKLRSLLPPSSGSGG